MFKGDLLTAETEVKVPPDINPPVLTEEEETASAELIFSQCTDVYQWIQGNLLCLTDAKQSSDMLCLCVRQQVKPRFSQRENIGAPFVCMLFFNKQFVLCIFAINK